MARKLDDQFIKDLLTGELSGLLEYVRIDHTLDLQIRENYINIYYLGGNILKVSRPKNTYQFTFDKKYLKPSVSLSDDFLDFIDDRDWYSYFPFAKQAMEFYFSRYPKSEREFQQLVVRENNYSPVANTTDFFVIDIEYDNREKARFDIIALEWPSVASNRKLQSEFKPKLCVFEMKYGDGAFSGSSGILKHYEDFRAFFNGDTGNEAEFFKREMLEIFKQKRELKVIPCLSEEGNRNQVEEFDDSVELYFLIANHDPEKTGLLSEVSKLPDNNVKFITANFLGYGLFNSNVMDLSEFKELLKQHEVQNP